MFVRALIVLLVVLNLGVAGWWALRAPPGPPPAPELPADVPRLQLASEAPASPVAFASPVPPPAATELPTDTVCHSFGPFPSRDAAQGARAALGTGVLQAVVRERSSGRVRGWRVVVPPLPTREQAVALAERIAAAGFTDYFVMREGADANAIALGRFRGEDSARRRAAELVAAGFAVRTEPVGGGAPQHWLDIAVPVGFDAVAAQRSLATGGQRVDCAMLTLASVR